MLASTVGARQDGKGAVADFVLHKGQDAVFVLREVRAQESECSACSAREGIELFEQTADYW
jgi:hypothetical protein